MPDWLRDIVVALIGGLFGAGGIAGLAQVLKARADARLAIEAQQDEYTLKLHQSLNASEEVFRNAVLGAYNGEVKVRREIEARLDAEVKARGEVEKQLTAITGERDLFKRQLEQAQTDLSAAHAKIRHLESEIAQLQQQQREHA